MTMIDGHMHLEYGDLSKEYVLEFVNAAKEKGLTKIQILDHTHRFKEFEPIYEELKAIPQQKKWLENKKMKFKDSLDDYDKLIQEVKALDLPVEVSFGLEVCYVPKHEEYIREVLSKRHYDFIVGAIHSINGKLYDMSFSKEILWDQEDVNDIYRNYYDLIFKLVKSDLFTQLAHPDTIKMFNYYPDYDLTPTYHQLADLLNEHHMKAENNTGCYYRYNHQDKGLSDQLLNIFKEHQVAMITASDAHCPDHVGMNIKDIYEKTMM